MVDLGGYVIILVETKDKQVKLYGSPAEKADLEVADEILEINGESLKNSSHTDVISHIHKCIKSRTICLRVKRRTGNKLAKELSENSHVQDAFVIAVEQQAKERLERLSALRKIKPVDMTKLSQQLCDSPPATSNELERFQLDHPSSPANTIYSAPVSELGSTANLNRVTPDNKNTYNHVERTEGTGSSGSNKANSKPRNLNQNVNRINTNRNRQEPDGLSVNSKAKKSEEAGYVTDEELELCQTIENEEDEELGSRNKTEKTEDKSQTKCAKSESQKAKSEGQKANFTTKQIDLQKSPSKEVLIADNSSRRSSKSSIQNLTSTGGNGNGIVQHNSERKTSIKNGQQQLKMVEEEDRLLKETSSKNRNMEKKGEKGEDHHHHQQQIYQKQSPQKGSIKTHKPLTQTFSLKAVVDHNDMLTCLTRVKQNASSTKASCYQKSLTQTVASLTHLLNLSDFQQLLRIHNTVQSLQCFQCPPIALCSDSRVLASECIADLNASVLPEVAEVLQLLQKLDVEALLLAHDKLALRQAALPWEKCVADMWTRERPLSSSASSASAICEMATMKSHNNVNKNNTSSSSNTKSGKENLTQDQQETSLNNNNNNNNETNKNKTMNFSQHRSESEERKLSQNLQQNVPDMTRVVKITKQNEPLGATVRNEGERVVIGRVVKGGAAERSCQLHPGDEVLEVNGLKLKGKSVHDICDTLCQMTGTLTFVIIPCSSVNNDTNHNQHQQHDASALGQEGGSRSQSQDNLAQEEVLHYRAHFNYNPDDDLYIPCHELGISFQRGDILHVINREDQHWWQAYRDGEWTQTLAGLIPSLALQQHRVALQKQKREQDLKEQRELERNSPSKKKSQGSNSSTAGGGGNTTTGSLLCARKSNKRKKVASPFKKADRFAVPPYEEMALYYPQPNQRRPLILVGPPSIGRHELRLRLLEDVVRFAAAVPHTSRQRADGEIDGQDYNFVSRSQFEEYVSSKRFVEHGEFDKQYYGTSLDSVRTVINSGKICVLNLQPGSLQILHDSDLKPYVVFLTPPSLQTYKAQRQKYGEAIKEDEYRESVVIATDMEEHYGHHFDSVIPFDDVDYVYEQLIYEINLLEREPQWVPAKWVKSNAVPLSCG